MDLTPAAIRFVLVPEAIDVDILKEQETSMDLKYKINARNLNPIYIHRGEWACETFQQSSGELELSPEGCEVCDCGTITLFKLLLAEMEQEENGKSRYFQERSQNELLLTMPRDLKIEPQTDSVDNLSGVLTWDTRQLNRHLKGFEITLSEGGSDLSLYKRSNETVVASPELGHSEGIDSIQNERLFTVGGSEKALTISDLNPGKAYSLVVRHKAPRAFNSVALQFSAPLGANLQPSQSNSTPAENAQAAISPQNMTEASAADSVCTPTSVLSFP